MSYIDLTTISDVLANAVIDEDINIANQCLSKTDRDINIVCLGVGVLPSAIPVTSAGVTTSDVLLQYGETMFLQHLFESVANSVEIADSYTEKIKYYWSLSEKYKTEITYYTVTGNEVVQMANRIKSVPCW